LHRIGKADSPICQRCKIEDKSVHYFLVRCPAYCQQRDQLSRNAGYSATYMTNLLSDQKLQKHLILYLGQTRRFKTVFGQL
ncbi:hypothetical protein CPB83DRAFT_729869, partial [Crepidotus variabilis]